MQQRKFACHYLTQLDFNLPERFDMFYIRSVICGTPLCAFFCVWLWNGKPGAPLWFGVLVAAMPMSESDPS
jgi:hypothetical protein